MNSCTRLHMLTKAAVGSISLQQHRRHNHGFTMDVFPPTLVKEDEALPETADCRMDRTVVLRWGHDRLVRLPNIKARTGARSLRLCYVYAVR